MSSPNLKSSPRPAAWLWGRLFTAMPPAVRIAAFLWVVVLVGIAGRIVFSPKIPPSVVPIYHAAALRWMAREDLYTPYEIHNRWDVFRYPPGFAPCYVPFAYLPLRLGELLWRAAMAAVLLSGLWLWTRHALQLNTGQRGALFALSVPLCLASLANGQANVLLLGLLLHGATAAALFKGKIASFCIAAATAIKIYPIAVGMLLSCVLPKKFLPWLVLSIAGWAAVPFLLAPADYIAGQYRRLVESVGADQRRNGHTHPPRDLYLVLQTYLVTPSERNYTALVLAVAAGMAAAVGITALRARDPKLALILAFDLGCVWMTVFGPATEPPTYTLLAPTIAAILLLSRRSPRQFALAIGAYALLIAPVIRDFFPNGRVFHDLGLQPIGGLLLLASILWKWLEDGIFCVSGRGGDMITVCEPPLPNLSATSRP